MKEDYPYVNTLQTSETAIHPSTQSKSHPAKRVDIVFLRMVKEKGCM